MFQGKGHNEQVRTVARRERNRVRMIRSGAEFRSGGKGYRIYARGVFDTEKKKIVVNDSVDGTLEEECRMWGR